jgi:hypothetical protein
LIKHNNAEFRINEEFRKNAAVFCRKNSEKHQIISAGEKLTLLVYRAKADTNLQDLRHTMFVTKLASSTSFVRPESLPPTLSAVL